MLINSGGAIALGTLLQALIGKEQYVVVDYVLIGIALTVVGVAVTAPLFFMRHIQGWRGANPNLFSTADPMRNVRWILMLVSLLCFISGMGMAVYGGFNYLVAPPTARPVDVSHPPSTRLPKPVIRPLTSARAQAQSRLLLHDTLLPKRCRPQRIGLAGLGLPVLLFLSPSTTDHTAASADAHE